VSPELDALAEEVSNWRRFLTAGDEEAALEAIRRHGRTGHPWGASRFLGRLEKRLGRRVRPGQPGRPRKAKGK